LVNILVRVTGEKYSTESFIKKIFPWEGTDVRKYVDSYCEDPPPPEFVFRIEKPYRPEKPRGLTGEPVKTGNLLELGELKEEPILKPVKKQATVPAPKPLEFELTWNWLQKNPRYEVSYGNGKSQEIKLGPIQLKPQQTAVTAREFTFRCGKMKDFLTVRQAGYEENQRILADELRSEAIRRQFTVSNLRVEVSAVKKPSPPKPVVSQVGNPPVYNQNPTLYRTSGNAQQEVLRAVPNAVPVIAPQVMHNWAPSLNRFCSTHEEREIQRRNAAANLQRETQEQSCVIS
jgi:hypothetical protein